ncbi:unnamed protein product [Oikopleura dioica]|uniref:Uncharacterized protein n=1 Tax=Oikopleura dioica TaxID=34765 RepID=E4XQE8_OIKDI|nr:unnamed protein product [Oikopleura dioica]
MTLSIFGGVCVAAKFLMYFGYKTQKAITRSERTTLNEFVNPSFEKSLLREIKAEQIRSKKNEEDAAISKIAQNLLARRTSVLPVVAEKQPNQNNHRMKNISEINEEYEKMDKTKF